MIRIANVKPRIFVAAALLGVSLSAVWACSPRSEPAQGAEADSPLSQRESASAPETEAVMRRFNQAFSDHDPTVFPDIIAQDVVMESMQPAPDGTRYEGYDVNLAFWQELAADRSTR